MNTSEPSISGAIVTAFNLPFVASINSSANFTDGLRKFFGLCAPGKEKHGPSECMPRILAPSFALSISFDKLFRSSCVCSGGRQGVAGKKPVTPTPGKSFALSTVQFFSACPYK